VFKLNSKRKIELVIIVASLGFAVLFRYYTLWTRTIDASPRRLMAGDRWTYKVLFPGSKSYQLTQSVQEVMDVNGTRAYLFLRDDAQHISTEYLWITVDWREIKTNTPYIGNIPANTTVTYTPPIDLFRFPLRVGERWTVNSTLRTTTILENTTVES
jgi:hypothetical protein